MNLDSKIKFVYTRQQLQALLGFVIQFDEARAIDSFDCMMKLVKSEMKALRKRLSKKYVDDKQKYSFSIPANEALALCLAAQALGSTQGDYEKIILFAAVQEIQQFYA